MSEEDVSGSPAAFASAAEPIDVHFLGRPLLAEPNDELAVAVADKVGSLRTAREFLRERAGSSKPEDMLRYLRRAPKGPPTADDLR